MSGGRLPAGGIVFLSSGYDKARGVCRSKKCWCDGMVVVYCCGSYLARCGVVSYVYCSCEIFQLHCYCTANLMMSSQVLMFIISGLFCMYE